MWFFPSTFPVSQYALFSANIAGRPLLTLFLMPDGNLSMLSSGSPDGQATFTSTKLKKGRWSHISFAWYPKRGGNPNLRMRLFELPDSR